MQGTHRYYRIRSQVPLQKPNLQINITFTADGELHVDEGSPPCRDWLLSYTLPTRTKRAAIDAKRKLMQARPDGRHALQTIDVSGDILIRTESGWEQAGKLVHSVSTLDTP